VDVVTALIAITPLFFIGIPQPKRNDSVEMVTPRYYCAMLETASHT